MKTGVVLVTHYQIGKEFLHALRLIVPNTPDFLTVSIDPKQSVDEMRQLIERALKQADRGAGVLVLTDMW
jgi:PTS system mannose-specific IIA component